MTLWHEPCSVDTAKLKSPVANCTSEDTTRSAIWRFSCLFLHALSDIRHGTWNVHVICCIISAYCLTQIKHTHLPHVSALIHQIWDEQPWSDCLQPRWSLQHRHHNMDECQSESTQVICIKLFMLVNGSSCCMVYKCDCTWWSRVVWGDGGSHSRQNALACQSHEYLLTRLNTDPLKTCLLAQLVQHMAHGCLGDECMLVNVLVTAIDPSKLHNCAGASTHSPLLKVTILSAP